MLPQLAHALFGALVLAASTQSADDRKPAPTISSKSVEAVQPAPTAPLLDRATRARLNLEALLNGSRFVGDLTAEELQDVIDFNRMLSNGASDTRSLAQRCVDQEVQRLGGNPSRLAWRVIELKCRDVG